MSQPNHDDVADRQHTSTRRAPISTMNITGLRHRVRGSSLRNASGKRFRQQRGVESAALDPPGRCVAAAGGAAVSAPRGL